MMSLSSFTANVNLGKLNEANDNATMKISPSNEETSALTRSRREEMMQKLYLQEKEKINQLPKDVDIGLVESHFNIHVLTLARLCGEWRLVSKKYKARKRKIQSSDSNLSYSYRQIFYHGILRFWL